MPDSDTVEVNLRTYLGILRRRLIWIVAVIVLSLAVAGAVISLQRKQYSATAELLVQPASGVTGGAVQQAPSPADVLTELQLLTSAPVKAQAAKKLGYQPSITASASGQTNVIEVTATSRTPAASATIANTYARVFVANQRATAIGALTAAEDQYQSQINAINVQILKLESSTSAAAASTLSALNGQVSVLNEELAQIQIAAAESPGGVEVAALAIPPSTPSSPKPSRDVFIALVVGVLLGVAAAFAAEYFDDKIYTRDQAKEFSGGVPVLAQIPRISGRAKARHGTLVTLHEPLSDAAESYRSLRTSLQFATHEHLAKTLLITSPVGSEGKTVTVANLAVVLANTGERVVIVEGDLRRPMISQLFGLADSSGLTSVLLGDDSLATAVRSVDYVPALDLLSAGAIPPNPADLLSSERAETTFRTLANIYDVVLIDGSPVLPVTDSLILSSYADDVVMVVEAGQTTGPQLQRASELLLQAGVRPVGLILNRAVQRQGQTSEFRYKHKNFAPQESPNVSLKGLS